MFVADKLRNMNLVHNLGAGTNPMQQGPEGVAVAKEHGELGILQSFDPNGGNVLMGGGVPSGGANASQPNTGDLTSLSTRPLFGEVRGINGV